MKRFILFSRMATLICSLCLVFEVVSFIVDISLIWGYIYTFIYNIILIVFPLLLMSQSKTFKTPATYILIASSLTLIDKLLGLFMRSLSNEAMMVMPIVLGVIYLLYLVFVFMGYFKLGKLLPKPSLSRSMAIAYPYTYILQFVVSFILGLFSLEAAVSVSLFKFIGVAQLLVITLLLFSFTQRNDDCAYGD